MNTCGNPFLPAIWMPPRKPRPKSLARFGLGASLGSAPTTASSRGAASSLQLFPYASPHHRGPREALRQIAFVHIRWRLWGAERELSAFCLLSLGVRDGGDNGAVYECKVNKAACGCDDMFLLSVMYSSSKCSRVMHLICCAIGSFRSA